MSELRRFEELPLREKILAVLGVVRAPVSRSFALELSGVDWAMLTELERLEIDNIFSSGDVIEFTSESGVAHYILEGIMLRRLFESVDRKSVSAQVGDNLWEGLFGSSPKS